MKSPNYKVGDLLAFKWFNGPQSFYTKNGYYFINPKEVAVILQIDNHFLGNPNSANIKLLIGKDQYDWHESNINEYWTELK